MTDECLNAAHQRGVIALATTIRIREASHSVGPLACGGVSEIVGTIIALLVASTDDILLDVDRSGVSLDFGNADGVATLGILTRLGELPQVPVPSESPAEGMHVRASFGEACGMPYDGGIVDADVYGSRAQHGEDESRRLCTRGARVGPGQGDGRTPPVRGLGE